MKSKLFYLLCLFAIACSDAKENESNPITVATISFKLFGGMLGHSETLILAPDSIHYYSLTGADVNLERHELTPDGLWPKLLDHLDLATFARVTSGESELPLDGLDTVYKIKMQTGEELSFVNGYGPDYISLQPFLNLVLAQRDEISSILK